MFGNSNPVFVDMLDDPSIDEDLPESKINENTQKLYYQFTLMEEGVTCLKIQELADKYNLIAIFEDAAQQDWCDV